MKRKVWKKKKKKKEDMWRRNKPRDKMSVSQAKTN